MKSWKGVFVLMVVGMATAGIGRAERIITRGELPSSRPAPPAIASTEAAIASVSASSSTEARSASSSGFHIMIPSAEELRIPPLAISRIESYPVIIAPSQEGLPQVLEGLWSVGRGILWLMREAAHRMAEFGWVALIGFLVGYLVGLTESAAHLESRTRKNT